MWSPLVSAFEDRRGDGSMEMRWKELQKVVVDLAEEHLHSRW